MVLLRQTDGGFFMSETQQQPLAIEALVSRRCDELGLSHKELIRRCGYKNVSKGLRRLEQLYAGRFQRKCRTYRHASGCTRSAG